MASEERKIVNVPFSTTELEEIKKAQCKTGELVRVEYIRKAVLEKTKLVVKGK